MAELAKWLTYRFVDLACSRSIPHFPSILAHISLPLLSRPLIPSMASPSYPLIFLPGFPLPTALPFAPPPSSIPSAAPRRSPLPLSCLLRPSVFISPMFLVPPFPPLPPLFSPPLSPSVCTPCPRPPCSCPCYCFVPPCLCALTCPSSLFFCAASLAPVCGRAFAPPPRSLSHGTLRSSIICPFALIRAAHTRVIYLSHSARAARFSSSPSRRVSLVPSLAPAPVFSRTWPAPLFFVLSPRPLFPPACSAYPTLLSASRAPFLPATLLFFLAPPIRTHRVMFYFAPLSFLLCTETLP